MMKLSGAASGFALAPVLRASFRPSSSGFVRSHLVAEKYTDADREKAEVLGGLPIRPAPPGGRLHQRTTRERHLGRLVRHSCRTKPVPRAREGFRSFSRVFKQTTGLSPLQFVTRERITRAQQMMRETKRSLIEIALEVG
jgi:AraC family transcriptional regulator